MFLLTTFSAAAQKTDQEPKRSAGYFFVAPGAFTTEGAAKVFHFGGGGEGLLKGGLGIAADIGYVTSFDNGGIGLFTVGPIFQLRRERKTVPFVTGGYSLVFREGSINLIHFGGGINHWFSDRLGLRLEARDNFSPEYRDFHAFQIRIGLLIR